MVALALLTLLAGGIFLFVVVAMTLQAQPRLGAAVIALWLLSAVQTVYHVHDTTVEFLLFLAGVIGAVLAMVMALRMDRTRKATQVTWAIGALLLLFSALSITYLAQFAGAIDGH